MRQIVLDTETTGLEPKQGHRIIEIGCVEIVNRRFTENVYHQYIQPDREIDEGAYEVHGISNEFLADKPRFKDVAEDFMTFVNGAELIIHNAPFDVGFLNHELSMLDPVWGAIADHCSVIDTLVMARQKHPGQKNNLDALCKRYEVNNSKRELHGALLDAELLAEVYLRMTGGQETLSLGGHGDTSQGGMMASPVRRVDGNRPALKVIRANVDELAAHEESLQRLGEACVWKRSEESVS
ncbi:MAG: DNA polymerase III subunit epsilon [Gammaproteobacteria bacterium]|nr:DNA polymerase III subunit epsilon [Gammaproteobacteria bacterium]MCW8909908.1 DNA polymerase III subunit epsilon [Gammaproteobacteria bacterium]MCW9005787.1 DNA polymerase III subunit epsilon [Gammaproteobacteria bacterium]